MASNNHDYSDKIAPTEGVYERFRSLTLTTYSIDLPRLIAQNLPHRFTFGAPKCAENGKNMALNRESVCI